MTAIKTLFLVILLFFITGCVSKQPNKSTSSTILIKTPVLKYHDKGFINYFDDYIHLQLLNIGTVVLDLTIYKTKVCESTFKCISSNRFNQKYLHPSYDEDFLYTLFTSKRIYFKDKKNNVFIKVK